LREPKAAPLSVTTSPGPAERGDTPVTCGASISKASISTAAGALGSLTETAARPTWPFTTSARISSSLTEVTRSRCVSAGSSPKTSCTLGAPRPENPLPVMTSSVPSEPDAGETASTCGAWPGDAGASRAASSSRDGVRVMHVSGPLRLRTGR
jgi:hypothetical protein